MGFIVASSLRRRRAGADCTRLRSEWRIDADTGRLSGEVAADCEAERECCGSPCSSSERSCCDDWIRGSVPLDDMATRREGQWPRGNSDAASYCASVAVLRTWNLAVLFLHPKVALRSKRGCCRSVSNVQQTHRPLQLATTDRCPIANSLSRSPGHPVPPLHSVPLPDDKPAAWSCRSLGLFDHCRSRARQLPRPFIRCSVRPSFRRHPSSFFVQ